MALITVMSCMGTLIEGIAIFNNHVINYDPLQIMPNGSNLLTEEAGQVKGLMA